MLDTLISSHTRIKLLLRLFLNPGSKAYLRGMAEEFGESTNAIRVELNRFEEAGMVVSESQGNKKMYKANIVHPFYKDLRGIIMKYVGIDQIIETVIARLGEVEKLYLTGDYAKGKDSGVIDLVLVGKVNNNYLVTLVEKAEKLIKRRIRFITYEKPEWLLLNRKDTDLAKYLLLWEKG